MPGSRTSIDSISHGRGGAGNIGADDTPYTDGEIVREGGVGSHGDSAFSTGRGGVANIGSPGLSPTNRKDQDTVPEVALRLSQDNRDFHVGRGGEGNIHIAEKSAKAHPVGLADKLKRKLFRGKII